MIKSTEKLLPRFFLTPFPLHGEMKTGAIGHEKISNGESTRLSLRARKKELPIREVASRVRPKNHKLAVDEVGQHLGDRGNSFLPSSCKFRRKLVASSNVNC